MGHPVPSYCEAVGEVTSLNILTTIYISDIIII
jgi:hypothetical protein